MFQRSNMYQNAQDPYLRSNIYQNEQDPYLRYNMYPFMPYNMNYNNYFQPFQLPHMNQPNINQPMFYPPKQPIQSSFYPHTPYPMMNKQNYTKQQPSQFSSFMSQFKTTDGNYDINKMMGTAGQMMNAMNQITGIVKQVGGFFIK
ncbi:MULTISPECIES: YppG family protein [unclassified Bacillus (in: firmicutes)]|uniref:YppG family protein n=1 Tax=unclassified Bacillus (in: firmicutes) TaxID=185979 RepID=UPI00232D21A9|nr:YppG family protein [Bacillus sp. BP-3]MDC2865684.1 YppG family protein [Bacillus sp. BP-3]